MKDKQYPLLNMDDFEWIAEQTKYSKSYVRKVVRGYVHTTERNQVIIDHAEDLQAEKMKSLKA
jgi:uncharacterized protein YnzC (UPF0291/DUF896 family)